MQDYQHTGDDRQYEEDIDRVVEQIYLDFADSIESGWNSGKQSPQRIQRMARTIIQIHTRRGMVLKLREIKDKPRALRVILAALFGDSTTLLAAATAAVDAVSPSTSSTSYNTPRAIDSFVIYAVVWLLTHVGNPSPPSHVTNTLALRTGTNPESIERWFRKARRVIKWDELVEVNFGGDEAGAVGAAKWHFSCRGPCMDEGVARELDRVWARARGYYERMFVEEELRFAKSVVDEWIPEW